MADNITLSGAVIAFDDVSSVMYQRVKPCHGADGSATDTSAAAPFPVTGGCVKSTPTILTQAVAVPGTAEALVAAETFAVYVLLTACKVDGDNSTDVFVGTAAVDKTSSWQNYLEPGDTIEITAPVGYKIDLNELYIDATTAADGVTGWYLPA